MLLHDCLSVNKNGNLEIGGADTILLAQKYGTPLYVMDEDKIRNMCRVYKNAMERHHKSGMILFAAKAFLCKYMCKILMEEGLGIDVVSGGELHTALSVGFPAQNIYFHGNNKTKSELEMALDADVGHIVVDNAEELHLLNSIAARKEKTVKIMFRIKPGIDAHTHDFIQTGQIDSKFGVALENGEAFEIIRIAAALSNIDVDGIHCHIGSQIFDLEPFTLAAKILMNFIGSLNQKLRIKIQKLNLGGGYGIKYLESDDPISHDKYIEAVSRVVQTTAAECGVDVPSILMEPGRSIVGESGITLYTVGSVKRIKDVRTYVAVDGGMADNPRYALYQAQYKAVVASRPLAECDDLVTIAGRCCESGDILIKDTLMPKLAAGDVVATLSTGAYNYSMASSYNRLPKPAVVMVRKGADKLVVRRETYEDVCRNDVV